MMAEIRRAESMADLAGARDVVLRVAERDLGYGYQPKWHWVEVTG